MSASARSQPHIHVRPEFEVNNLGEAALGDVARPLSAIERLWNVNAVRKLTILFGLVALWQACSKLTPNRVARWSKSYLLSRASSRNRS